MELRNITVSFSWRHNKRHGMQLQKEKKKMEGMEKGEVTYKIINNSMQYSMNYIRSFQKTLKKLKKLNRD